MSRCPDSTRIAAYLDDRLFEEERRVLDEHFASCGSCWPAFADSVACLAELRAGDEEGTPPAPGRWWLRAAFSPSHRRWMAAAAVALVTTAATGWWLRHELAGGERSGELAGTSPADAVERRPVLPRLSLMTAWQPRPEDRVRAAGAAMTPQPGAWRYLKMVDDARAAAGESPGGEQLQRLGAAYLLAGNSDQGLQTLERAAAAEPGDAQTLSDVAAAYLARGIARGDGNDVAEALETVERALEASPNLLEARFNRALALEEMPLPHEAARAWRAYLELDSRSPWAAEAQDRLRRLDRATPPTLTAAQLRVQIVAAAADEDSGRLSKLVGDHRQEAREAFTLDLLPAWAEATIAGDESEAAERLGSARRLAAVWEQQTGDRSLLAQAAEVEGDPAQRGGFARGQRALARGIEALEELRIEEAVARLRIAGDELPPTSVAASWAELYSVACRYYLDGADPRLSERLEILAPAAVGDAPLRGYLGWLRGLLHFARGEAEAIGQFRDSLGEFERLDETDHIAWLHSLSADADALFGNLTRSWFHRREVLAAMPRLTHPERRFEILLGPAISAAYLERRPHVAAVLMSELAESRTARAPRQEVELELWRSRVQLILGKRDEARAEFQAGNAWLLQVEDADLRRRLAADLQAVAGSLAESPPARLDALSRSIDRSRAGAPDFRFPGLLLERARSYRLLGDTHRAAADLREGAAWLSRQAAGTAVQSLWSERLAGGDALFRELVSVNLAAGNPEEAFETAERARAQAFMQSAGIRRQAPTAVWTENRRQTLRSVQESVGPGTALLYYCLLEKEALLWRVDSTGTDLIRLAVQPEQLVAWARRLQADLSAGAWTSGTRDAARRLYGELVTPARLGADVRKVVVVPDGALDQLPFAALVDPRTELFLVEQLAVEVAPSAGQFLAAQVRIRQMRDGRSSVLAFGDPHADPALYPDLPSLPAAAAEARQVARLYRRGDVLVGEGATREAMLTRSGDYDVLHFAGHALVNSVDPSRSSLALARAPGSLRPGALFAFELPAVRFTRTRLVVLAGCGTASRPERTGGGTLSLASAFLAAQVPTVVASLWPVSDGGTAELMAALHANLSRGEEPAEALRAAQVSMLRSSESERRGPAAWAAFQAHGG